MSTEIYGLDWYNGDGLNSAYKELADAQLDVLNYIMDNHLEEVSLNKYTIGIAEESAYTLAMDAVSIVDDWYIDDMVNIVSISLIDKFTP